MGHGSGNVLGYRCTQYRYRVKSVDGGSHGSDKVMLEMSARKIEMQGLCMEEAHFSVMG